MNLFSIFFYDIKDSSNKLLVCPLLLSRKVKFSFYSAEWDLNIFSVNYCTVVKKKKLVEALEDFDWVDCPSSDCCFVSCVRSTFKIQIKSLSSFLCVVFFSWLVFIMRMTQLPCQACNSFAYSACTLHLLKIFFFSEGINFKCSQLESLH